MDPVQIDEIMLLSEVAKFGGDRELEVFMEDSCLVEGVEMNAVVSTHLDEAKARALRDWLTGWLGDGPVVIDEGDLEAARRDPRRRELMDAAAGYWAKAKPTPDLAELERAQRRQEA